MWFPPAPQESLVSVLLEGGSRCSVFFSRFQSDSSFCFSLVPDWYRAPTAGYQPGDRCFIYLTRDCTMHKVSVPPSAGQGLDLSAVDSLTCNRSLSHLLWQVAEEEILRFTLAQSCRRGVKCILQCSSIPLGIKCEVFFCSRVCWSFACFLK